MNSGRKGKKKIGDLFLIGIRKLVMKFANS